MASDNMFEQPEKVTKELPQSTNKNKSTNFPSASSVVKREVTYELNSGNGGDILYPYNPTEVGKRSATGLNKFIYVLRNTFEKPASPLNENELGVKVKENENFSEDINRALARGSFDKYPAALVERRGQTQKDRKIYLRCYFNAVSCFKKK